MKIEIHDRYEPKKVEDKWYKFWESKGYFHAEPSKNSIPYCIVIPPPNVTGSLHMGHALNNTLQDILIRLKRMKGFNTLWMPGTDHAGIATQFVVERQLAAKGISKEAIGREAFIKKIWEWKKESGDIIINQLKRLGASCDWARERFTMDPGLSRAVREVFVGLYEKGLLYREDYIVNWCPRCRTALSDLEVEHESVSGKLYYIKYPFKEYTGEITVATTRPETMLGDTAVAVHPEDERYKKYIGRIVILPLVGREMPVITDSYVDPKFGTGALKITPAHDANDFLIGQRHKLAQVKVIDEDAKMSAQAGKWAGMDRDECRKEIVIALNNNGHLVKIEDYPGSIGLCYRCRTAVEPNLSMQWFVKTKPLAEPAIEAVRNGRVRIIPKVWENTYFEWMENIRDWCISRQIWWGHRIPVWYCNDCGEINVSRDDITECKKCSSNNIKQDTDVLDTWFSSALWPFSTLGWPDQTGELKFYYPTSVLVTAFDILFFWVARMIMMGLKFMGDVPFNDVYIHALIRDMEGQKMSKSRGNVIDPLDMMDKYGTDAFRFALTAFAAQGRDIRMSEERIEGYRNFSNKIWNAARFILSNLDGYDRDVVNKLSPQKSLADKWIIWRFNHTVKKVNESIDEYKFNEVAQVLYQFLWHEFCDWYIELSKIDLNKKEDYEKRIITQHTLINIYSNSMKLLHPIMPFITEEIWQKLPKSDEQESIMTSIFPDYSDDKTEVEAEETMERIIDIIKAIRNIRGEMNVAPGKRIKTLIRTLDKETSISIQEVQSYIEILGKTEVDIRMDIKKPPFSATTLIGPVEIYIPLSGVIDIDYEKKRLSKEINKLEMEMSIIKKKLDDESFIKRAPEHIKEKEVRKFEENMNLMEKLVLSLKKLE